MSNRPWKTLDLFSGAGGLALGFSAEGARCVGALERDGAAARTFGANFRGDDPVVLGGDELGDANRVSPGELLAAIGTKPDIIVGGPPCQGFSRIGRAKQQSLLNEDQRLLQGGVRDPQRNELYRYFLAVVRAARPKAFVMENVPGMREMLGIDHAGRVAREAATLGYNVRYFLLNAVHYGVPQVRWRLFFVGLRADLGLLAVPTPPPRTHRYLASKLEGASLPEDRLMLAGSSIPEVASPAEAVTALEALGDLPRLTAHLETALSAKRKDRRLPIRRTPSEWAAALRDWPGRPPPQTVSGNLYRATPRDYPIFMNMAQGDRYPYALRVAGRHLESRRREAEQASGRRMTAAEAAELRKAVVPPYRNDAFDDKWRKLHLDAPSWTLTAHLSKDSYSHIHYDSRQARTITVREAARLQSFPDAFEFLGSMGQQFRQVGNAVPPLLGRAIAKQLFRQLADLPSGEGEASAT